MKKIIFISVDTQKDFMNPDGKLYVPGAEKIKPKLAELSEFGRLNQITRVSTADYHIKGDKEISDKPDFINTFPPHCMVGTEGIQIIEETYPKFSLEFPCDPKIYLEQQGRLAYVRNYNTITIFKNQFDVFKGNKFTDKIIEILAPDVVAVYGVATDICVKAVVDGLVEQKIDVILVKDATKGLSKGLVDELIKYWVEDDGVKLMNTKQVIKMATKDYVRFATKEPLTRHKLP